MFHALGPVPSHFKSATSPAFLGFLGSSCSRTPDPGLASPFLLAQVSGVSLGSKRGSYLNEKSIEDLCFFFGSRGVWAPCGFILQVDHHACILLGQLTGCGDACSVWHHYKETQELMDLIKAYNKSNI